MYSDPVSKVIMLQQMCWGWLGVDLKIAEAVLLKRFSEIKVQIFHSRRELDWSDFYAEQGLSHEVMLAKIALVPADKTGVITYRTPLTVGIACLEHSSRNCNLMLSSSERLSVGSSTAFTRWSIGRREFQGA